MVRMRTPARVSITNALLGLGSVLFSLLSIEGVSASYAPSASGGPNGTRTAAHLESELTRAAYKKLGVAKEKDWVVSLPKAFIHVFGEQGTGNRE